MNQDLPSIEDLTKGMASANKPSNNKTQSPPSPAKKAGQDTVQEKFEEKMVEVRIQEKEDVAKREAENLGVEYINLKGFPVSPEALTLLPQERAEELQAVAFLFTGPEIRIGAIDPKSETLTEVAYQLGERNKARVDIYKITEHSLQQAIKLYDTIPKIKVITKGVNITDEELNEYRPKIKNLTSVQELVESASATDVMVILMAAALELGTSDVHMEAEETHFAVRMRIDGMLQEIAKLPKESQKKILSRVKLIAGIKINISDRPQDGRFTIFLTEEKVEVRTSTLPTAYGESVVMRLLRSGSIQLGFEQLGLRQNAFKKLEKEISKPHGMIITTGPTGSGKTTTLYAILKKLNNPDVKLITLEDPIEYKVEGINQSQINHAKEYTFAKGLRSILRQDPDIVMVGEIRDLETGEVAIQAALTGHLMLSTIHTNDAAGAIPRFLSMGTKPFLLAPSLNAIIGQRLVRKIHEDCKEEIQLEPKQLEEVKAVLAEIPENSGESIEIDALKFYKGKGCQVCNDSGYKGRVGIYEILTMSPEVEQQILSGNVSEYQMREIAKQQGMTTMIQDGLLKAADGITTVEEVFRVATT